MKAKVSPKGKVPTLKVQTKAIPKALSVANAAQQPVKANAKTKGKIHTLKAKEKEILKLPSAAKANGKPPLEHDPQLQHAPKLTSTNRREQSCVELLYFSMYALEARISSESFAGLPEMERTPAAYAFQRYQKLGVAYKAARESAYNAATRAKSISQNNCQCQLSQLSSLTHVDFNTCRLQHLSI